MSRIHKLRRFESLQQHLQQTPERGDASAGVLCSPETQPQTLKKTILEMLLHLAQVLCSFRLWQPLWSCPGRALRKPGPLGQEGRAGNHARSQI